MICHECNVKMTAKVVDSTDWEAMPHIDIKIECPKCGAWLHKTLDPYGNLMSASTVRGSDTSMRESNE